MILAIRTDSAQSQLQLINQSVIAEKTWLADRELAKTLYSEIALLLESTGCSFDALSGIVVYQGPGSFTGLRIGATVANTLAYGLNLPIVGCSGDGWQQEGAELMSRGIDHKMVLPEYGQDANITLPKK